MKPPKKPKTPKKSAPRSRPAVGYDPKAAAQELFLDAMTTDDSELAGELILRALKLDPHNIDANLYLLESLDPPLDEKVADLKKILGWATRELGAKFFKANTGYFWGLIETRPYMRVRANLAQALLESGREEDAITEFAAMLVLNPDDNQGIRYALLGLYLCSGRVADAQKLLEQYEGDAGVAFQWGRVLWRFLSGDEQGAAQELWSARARNRHCETFLAARERLPVELPDSYLVGSLDEALIASAQLDEAWRRNPEAVVWLRGVG